MTGRRKKDPRTRVPEQDEQRGIETIAPDLEEIDAEAAARAQESPTRSKFVRGGAASTWAPTTDRTLTAQRMEAVRAQVRARAAAEAAVSTDKKKRKPSWVVWLVAFLVLGGIGFGVAWFVMNPPGEGEGDGVQVANTEEEEEPATDESEAAADASGERAADATGGEESDATAIVAADAADAGPTKADATGAEEDVAVAAVDDASGDGGTDSAAVAAADTSDDTAGGADAEMVAAATDAADASGDGGDGAAAAADAEPDDAAVVASADGGAVVGSDAASEAAADAKAPEKEPALPNPLEAARLNEDGLALRKKGDHAGALKVYEQAVAADPGHVWARYNYACELALAGRDRDALAQLTKLYKLGTADAKKALAAARSDSDFASIKDTGQFFRLTNF